MAAKLTAEWDTDITGRYVLLVKKSRGKITIDELTEFLLWDSRFTNHAYAIVIRVYENMCEGSGWDIEEAKGDVVELYQLEDGDDCPVCGSLLVYQNCPECGAELRKKV